MQGEEFNLYSVKASLRDTNIYIFTVHTVAQNYYALQEEECSSFTILFFWSVN